MNENRAKIYSLLMAVFVVMLVLTNIIGTKIFVLFGETFPNGFFGFPEGIGPLALRAPQQRKAQKDT